MHSFWRPHKGQLPVAIDLFRKRLRYVFLQCGRKFGKTDFALYCMYMMAIMFPGSQIYYIADTMKHANELVWANGRVQSFFLKPKRWAWETDKEFEMRREIGKELHAKYIDRANSSEMRVYFKNGSFIKVDGAENYANADGIEPDFMVYDEFKSHDPRFNEAMEPNLRVKKAPLLIVGTPPEELNTYYEKIAKTFKKLSYASHYRRPSYMNPFIYPEGRKDPEFLEECEKYLIRGDDDVMRRELFAEIVVNGNKALFPKLELPEFDYDLNTYNGFSKHVVPYSECIKRIIRNPKDWEFFDTYDAGSVTCFAVLIGVMNRYTKEVIIMDQVYETSTLEMSTRGIYPRVEKKMQEIFIFEDYWIGTYDNAAAWFRNEVLDLYERNLNPCEKDLKNKENKLGMIRDMLDAGKLVFTERCLEGIQEDRGVLWEMINYRKDAHGKIPKENDHAIDALRYKINAMMYDPKWIPKPKSVASERRGLSLAMAASMDRIKNVSRRLGEEHTMERIDYNNNQDIEKDTYE